VPVVAASFGGFVALDLALRAPERVAGLVLLDSDLDESAESAELAAFAAEEEAALDAGDVAAAVEANVRMWVTRGDRDVDPSVVDLVSAMQRDAFEAQMGVDAELDEPDPPVASRLGEIGVPALVIVGADDVEDFVRLGERLAGDLPGAGPLVRIAGAAHLPALERPDDVAAVVVPFLRARCASP
jgi:pimeloyl-ACP methyl ester carboxylesterase